MDILFLEPVFKEMVWGGNTLERFGYAIPSDRTGECWAISAHPNGECVVKNGAYQGRSLGSLWKEHRELFGNAPGDEFPLLVKIIDAREDLSIQVHPDDDYAREHENGSLGKTECWYVLDCRENASIVIGHHAGDRKELQEMVRQGRFGELIREIPVKKGDFFQIEPGTLHAIKGGTLILETQQSSDVTYRVYDYDRQSNGKKRPLHIEKSLDVLKAPFTPPDQSEKKTELCADGVTCLEDCGYYTVWKIDVAQKTSFRMERAFMNLSLVEGEGTVNGVEIKKGDHFILPAGFGEVCLQGRMELIASALPL